ncbi:MAG: hypothetical protein ACREBO_02970 [Novosphingobium sp.]
MRAARLLAGLGLALTSVLALAQDAPESLLPPGFERPKGNRPAPTPAPTPRPAPGGAQPNPTASPVVQALPGGGSALAAALPRNLPSLQELEGMSPEQLDQLLGLRPRYDIPPAARRSLKQIGVLAESEGGFAPGSFAGQDAALVRGALSGNRGRMVSRWGHILLRRALVSRVSAPQGIAPADFVALRAALLVRMGEGEAARALVQDVDAANFTPGLTQAAIEAYVATADLTGMCPAVRLQGGVRKDPEWQVASSICRAFAGEGAAGLAQLDRMNGGKVWPRIDLLLAQKYAGAAGKAQRAVTIEWDGVAGITPWRYALTIATGLEPPASLMQGASWRYDTIAATAPMLGLSARAAGADRAAAVGALSSAAMVDLYAQIYAQNDMSGEWAGRADRLREAYVAESEGERLAAIKGLWDDSTGSEQRYGRQVLTAYAAARLPARNGMAGDAAPLIASMLAAGLDRNALRWASQAEVGSEAWALLTLAAPTRSAGVSGGALDTFYGDDASAEYRKSAFLVAGLAGLGRVDGAVAGEFASKLGIDLTGQTKWTRAIDSAAEANNPAMVALLAGLGMQGEGWDKMTPRFLFRIVSALRLVGLEAEARMIAAEAVARG